MIIDFTKRIKKLSKKSESIINIFVSCGINYELLLFIMIHMKKYLKLKQKIGFIILHNILEIIL